MQQEVSEFEDIVKFMVGDNLRLTCGFSKSEVLLLCRRSLSLPGAPIAFLPGKAWTTL